MCGILAILLADDQRHCRQDLYDGLTTLQHRGQDAAGIITTSTTLSAGTRNSRKSTKLHLHKSRGLVRDVFSQESLSSLVGHKGLAHCRYPTAGNTTSHEEAQPMYLNFPCGLALVHNGNLTNCDELCAWLRRKHRHLNTDSDSEVLLNVFAEYLKQEIDHKPFERLNGHSKEVEVDSEVTIDMIFTAVKKTMGMIKGGYAVSLIIHDVGLVCFRDPKGIRPLVYGTRNSSTILEGVDYCFSSESVSLDILNFDFCRDVKPGECILVLPMVPDNPRSNKGFISRQIINEEPITYPCLFEYVYLARPDSVMNGVSVYQSRLKMGEKLAKKILRDLKINLSAVSEFIDKVIPVPDTSRPIAMTCAKALGIPYCEGFIKNRYIGRTFIMPEQGQRQNSIRLKLNPIKSEFQGNKILMVDDSIVRGNTSRKLVQLAKDAGATCIYFASAAPEVRFRNIYGIDLPTQEELIAHDRSTKQIADVLSCEKVFFQTLEDLEDSVSECVSTEANVKLGGFESSTFDGKYMM
eukprot:snap_masked-scaffold_11-processed-gene-5.36-mRNA-1 protein AED:0.02 eAED:0.02 QI:0/-1/0/1/-1/1/1/0/521